MICQKKVLAGGDECSVVSYDHGVFKLGDEAFRDVC